MDPTISQQYVHDRWLDFPASYVRVHHEKRRTFYVPPEDQGFASRDIEEARMTSIITDDGVTWWVHENWHERGELELDRTLLVRHVFAKLAGTLMMILFLQLTILWRRKQRV